MSLAGLLLGCAAAPRQVVDAKPKAVAPPEGAESVQTLTVAGHIAAADRADMRIAAVDNDVLFQLDVYQLTVPVGAISGNDRFWSRVDEDRIDLATHDVLMKNGVRVGIAPTEEWSYFKDLIERYGATAQKGSISPTRKGSVELPLHTNIESEDIFYLNSHGVLYGRSYEKCDNILAVSFEPTPRHLGDARIDLCAVIRGVRRQYEVTVLNDERQIELRRPEFLYDLRLSQDVARDHFLVVAPSSLATLPDNLGHTFFVSPAGPNPTETVLLLAPRPYRVMGKTSNLPTYRPMQADKPGRSGVDGGR